MDTPGRKCVLIVAACLVAGSCGGPTIGGIEKAVPQLGESDQSARCKVVKDASRPMLVEWPATDKAALQAQTAQGIAVARYDGCRLKLLTGCRVDGDYAFLETSRAKDGFRIADEAELFAKLPLGAVSLEGEIKQGHELSLSYVAVGARTTTESVSADRMSGSCEGATHFVRAMIVGAYELSSRASASGRAGVEVKGIAEAGGKAGKEGEVLRADGDLQACLDPSTPATSRSCQAIVQLDLAPIEGAVEAPEKEAPRPVSEPSPSTGPIVAGGASPSTDGGDEVAEPGTSLVWLRCPVGTLWNGRSCAGGGMAVRVTWDEAVKSCPPAYRLPTRKELTQLLGGCDRLVGLGESGRCAPCDESAACASMFTVTHRRGQYWSSDPFDENAAFWVSFRDGAAQRSSKNNQMSVLCVRTGKQG
jgi:hypothetical protein